MCFWSWRQSASVSSYDLPRSQTEDSETGSSDEQSQPLKIAFLIKCWRFWRQKFWWTSPASEELKTLKTKCQRLWRQKFWWTSTDSTGLKFWRSRKRFVDSDQASSAIQINQKSKKKVQETCTQYIGLNSSYKKVTFNSAKSTARRWVVNKFYSLSHNG